MKSTGNLKLTTPGDREIVMTRALDAPRRLVFDAFTKPELVKQWLLGPPGWSMPICEIDLRVGGAYRYVWRRESDGSEMGMGGVYREIAAPERLVATEKFDQPWYPDEAVGTTVLGEQGGKTTITQTVLYQVARSPRCGPQEWHGARGSPRATTGLRSCWHRKGLQAWKKERVDHD